MYRRYLPCLALAFALLLTALPIRAAGQEATPEHPFAAGDLDLAAMLVTTADLDAIGFPGFGRFGNGFFISFEGAMQNDADALGLTQEEARTWYEDIGFLRAYAADFGLPSIPGDDQSFPNRGAFSRIHEFENAAGAAEYLSRTTTAVPQPESAMTTIDAPFALGEGTVIIDEIFHDPVTNGRFYNSTVAFHSGNLFVATGFFRVVEGAATPVATPAAGAEPSVSAATYAELESFGRRQLERIETVRTAGAPNLPNLVLRVGADPREVAAHYSEGYRLLDGELLPYYGGFEDDILADPAATTGALAAYELEEAFQPGEEPAPGDPYLLVRLYLFPDEATASAFMASRPDAIATGGFAVASDAAPEAGSELLPGEATDLGDESLAFSFVRAFNNGDRFEGYEVFVRVGEIVAAVSLEGSPDMPLEQVTEIAAAQAACLEAGACPNALPVSAVVRALPSATPSAATPAA
jgi:hypothetical protein